MWLHHQRLLLETALLIARDLCSPHEGKLLQLEYTSIEKRGISNFGGLQEASDEFLQVLYSINQCSENLLYDVLVKRIGEWNEALMQGLESELLLQWKREGTHVALWRIHQVALYQDSRAYAASLSLEEERSFVLWRTHCTMLHLAPFLLQYVDSTLHTAIRSLLWTLGMSLDLDTVKPAWHASLVMWSDAVNSSGNISALMFELVEEAVFDEHLNPRKKEQFYSLLRFIQMHRAKQSYHELALVLLAFHWVLPEQAMKKEWEYVRIQWKLLLCHICTAMQGTEQHLLLHILLSEVKSELVYPKQDREVGLSLDVLKQSVLDLTTHDTSKPAWNGFIFMIQSASNANTLLHHLPTAELLVQRCDLAETWSTRRIFWLGLCEQRGDKIEQVKTFIRDLATAFDNNCFISSWLSPYQEWNSSVWLSCLQSATTKSDTVILLIAMEHALEYDTTYPAWSRIRHYWKSLLLSSSSQGDVSACMLMLFCFLRQNTALESSLEHEWPARLLTICTFAQLNQSHHIMGIKVLFLIYRVLQQNSFPSTFAVDDFVLAQDETVLMQSAEILLREVWSAEKTVDFLRVDQLYHFIMTLDEYYRQETIQLSSWRKQLWICSHRWLAEYGHQLIAAANKMTSYNITCHCASVFVHEVSIYTLSWQFQSTLQWLSKLQTPSRFHYEHGIGCFLDLLQGLGREFVHLFNPVLQFLSQAPHPESHMTILYLLLFHSMQSNCMTLRWNLFLEPLCRRWMMSSVSDKSLVLQATYVFQTQSLDSISTLDTLETAIQLMFDVASTSQETRHHLCRPFWMMKPKEADGATMGQSLILILADLYMIPIPTRLTLYDSVDLVLERLQCSSIDAALLIAMSEPRRASRVVAEWKQLLALLLKDHTRDPVQINTLSFLQAAIPHVLG